MAWEPFSDLVSPWEYRWTVGYNGGFHTQILQLDHRAFALTAEDAAKVGIHNWRTFVAPLLSSSCDLALQETISLFNTINSRIDVPPYSPGGVPDDPCDPGLVPVWVSHTVDTDRWARRPFYWPGTPESWVSGGMLNDQGCRNHMTMARAVVGGFGECWTPGTQQVIRFERGNPLAPPGHPDQPRWRKVLHWRVCTHLDRPPGGL